MSEVTVHSSDLKDQVRAFWDRESCGERYAQGSTLAQQLEQQAEARYQLEPYIGGFASFAEGRDRDVLEIGVGMGADHLEWARARPRSLTGIDLTARAVDFTRQRLELDGYTSKLLVADAEHLPFLDESFDLVYSWGVLHHSPDTPGAIREIWRVLRPGGTARVMIYHAQSVTGLLLYLRYGLLAGRIRRSLEDIYAHHLESPGTKAYSRREARIMFSQFQHIRLETQLASGELMLGDSGQRHQGVLLTTARRVWPRRLIRQVAKDHGLFLLIEVRK